MRRLFWVTISLVLYTLLTVKNAPASIAQAVINGPEVFGSIGGTVLETSGQPAVGIIVSAYTYDGYTWVLYTRTMTDNTGRYTLARLTTNTYRVGFSDEEGRYREQYYTGVYDLYNATDIVVNANHLIGLDATLLRLARIAGLITVPDALSVSSLSVNLYRRSGSSWLSSGDRSWYSPPQRQFPFSFGRLESGFYYLSVRSELDGIAYTEYFDNAFSLDAATILSVTAGSTITDVRIIIGENPAGAILAGRITGLSGAPLSGISVTAYQTATTEWTPERTVKTDRDGNYLMKLLAPTLYVLRFSDETRAYATEYFNDAATIAGATPITLVPGGVSNNLDAQLAPTGRMRGLITRYDGSVPESVTLLLYTDMNGQRSFLNNYFIYRGEDGVLDYQLTGLTPAVYYLRATTGDADTTGFAEFYQDALTLEQATPITVSAGETTDAINFVLGDRAAIATISGRVTDLAERPLPGILVEATLLNRYPPFAAKTMVSGAYQITVTRPGTYTVRFSDPAGAYRSQFYDRAEEFQWATPIVLTAGANHTAVNATLSPFGQLLGTVALYDGSQPDGLDFTLYRLRQEEWEPTYQFPSLTVTNNGVNFLYKSLLPGIYRLGAKLRYSTEFTQTLYYSTTYDFERATNITMTTGATVSGIDFVLGEDTANGRIEGTVRSGATPLAGIKVELYRSIDNYRWPILIYLWTDGNGHFRIDGLKRGRYRISFRPLIPPDIYGEPIFWGGGANLEEARIIDLGSTTVIDLGMDLSQPYNLFVPVAAR